MVYLNISNKTVTIAYFVLQRYTFFAPRLVFITNMHRPTKSLLICLFLTMCDGFSMGCRWMDDHKFIQHSETLMNLLNIMGGEFTTDSVDVPFPEDLYKQAEYLPTDDTIWFILQTLDKIAELFDGELDSVWNEKKVEIFLSVLNSQSDGLQSCVTAQKKNSKNLQMYFKRLHNQVLKRMAYSAHAWELVRKEVRTHLMRLVLLGSATENSI